MRQSTTRTDFPNTGLDSMMRRFFLSVARKKDTGITSDDLIVTMRRQNPYKFVNKDVQNLVHSMLGTDGVDIIGFRNLAGRIINDHVEDYLNECMDALQVGSEGCLTRYRLEMLFCQEIGADVSLTKEAFEDLTEESQITVETIWHMIEGQNALLSALVKHIFRKELNLDSGVAVLDRFTSTTADQLSRKKPSRCCCLL